MSLHRIRDAALPRAGRRLLATAAAVAVAMVALALVTPSAVSADEPYTGTFTVQCDVQLDIDRADGFRLRAQVEADVVGNVEPRGRVTATFTVDGERAGTASAPYRGRPLVLDGPRTDGSGRFAVTMTFVPDDGRRFTRCTARDDDVSDVLGAGGTTGPDSGAGSDGAEVDDGVGASRADGADGVGAGSPGGLLPDAGGPALRVALLGLLLVMFGAVLMRRRGAGGATAPANPGKARATG